MSPFVKIDGVRVSVRPTRPAIQASPATMRKGRPVSLAQMPPSRLGNRSLRPVHAHASAKGAVRVDFHDGRIAERNNDEEKRGAHCDPPECRVRVAVRHQRDGKEAGKVEHRAAPCGLQAGVREQSWDNGERKRSERQEQEEALDPFVGPGRGLLRHA